MKENIMQWLEDHSMLYQASCLCEKYAAQPTLWKNTYSTPRHEALLERASVWFSVYPVSMITEEEQSLLGYLGTESLWQAFSNVGIEALHTGPMKKAGGWRDDTFTPTVDGWFDRISLQIDSAFGTEEEYKHLVKTAAQHGGIIAGDLVPGHTGKGPDFRLAARHHKEYSGIYVMINIPESDWSLLPEVNDEWDSVNLPFETVDLFTEKGYLPGRLQRVLFSNPGSDISPSGWDATGIITGVDGVRRRWVYLHFFKSGQPTMNWMDPSGGASRIVMGDVIKTIQDLGACAVRLDANPFLGIERKPGSRIATSECHPLAVMASEQIAWQVRRFGGWSFQELNMSLEEIKRFSDAGPDFSYDFITRPAVQHALLTGDATFLKFMLDFMLRMGIRPARLIHSMQNHDEITYELVHFIVHADETFEYDGETLTGDALRTRIRTEMEQKAISPKTPYNHLSGNGLCTTLTGLAGTRLGITDIWNMDAEQTAEIMKAHLLLVLFNSMQPGIFNLSGWDLVGALPLPVESIPELVADGDTRWVNRGAYDLLGSNPSCTASRDGLPVAKNLYGTITEQLTQPRSFVRQLRRILSVRKKYNIDRSTSRPRPETTDRGVVVLLNELPDQQGLQLTALNFGFQTAHETLHFPDQAGQRVTDIIQDIQFSALSETGQINLTLAPLEGRIFLIK